MTKPAAFTQAEITKVLKGAKAAGVKLSRIEIDRSGKIVALIDGAKDDASAPNPWDEVFNAQEKRAS